jgi:hypothetical protein
MVNPYAGFTYAGFTQNVLRAVAQNSRSKMARVFSNARNPGQACGSECLSPPDPNSRSDILEEFAHSRANHR